MFSIILHYYIYSILKIVILPPILSSNSLAILYCSTAFNRSPILIKEVAYREYISASLGFIFIISFIFSIASLFLFNRIRDVINPIYALLL